MVVEEDTVRLLKEKDVTAFGRLYDCYAPALYSMVLKLTPDKLVAGMILKESFLKCWQQIGAFDSAKEELLLWMMRITIKVCKDVLQLTMEILLQRLDLSKALKHTSTQTS